MTDTNDEESSVGNSECVKIPSEEYSVLRQERAILREIRNTCPLTYFIFGIGGETTLQSDNLERLTGWTVEEAYTGHVARQVTDDDMAKLMTSLQEASERPGEAIVASYTMARKDGRPVHVRTNILFMADNPDIDGYLGISQIIDREQKLEEEIEALKAQIARMQQLDAVGTLASGIAHDFNNVLQAMIGNADLAQIALPEHAEQHRYLEGIFKAGRAGQDLVTKLLTYARKRPLVKQVVELTPCVHDAIALLEVALPHGVGFETAISDDIGYLFDDPIHIHQIVLNLGTNAIAAVTEGGTVRIALEEAGEPTARGAGIGELRKGHYARLTIQDNGEGMDEETLSKVFQPFFTTKEIGRGTGLGLAVVAGIVEAQGGALDMRSEPGLGTIVEIYLPLISREEAMTKGLAEVNPEGSERVAVIDDDPGVLFVAKTFLDRLGYDAVHYTSANDFLSELEHGRRRFDVLITDLTMPEVSGVQLARRVIERHPELPIILTSGFDDPLQSVASPPHNIKVVLRKPYSATDIGRVIQRVIKGL